MNKKQKVTLNSCGYNFVYYTVLCILLILENVIVFGTFIFTKDLLTIGSQYGLLLFLLMSIFRCHCNKFFANRHPELFTVIPFEYVNQLDKDQAEVQWCEIVTYVIINVIGIPTLALQHRWLILIYFIVLSVINFLIGVYSFSIDNLIIPEKHFRRMQKHPRFFDW